MILSDICVRRPVFATVLNLLLVLLGVIAFERLTVREYPNIDPPIVSVSTAYRGASAEIVETQVTKILEEALAGIEGIDVMTSVSRAENSFITVRFNIERDIDVATNDVRDKLGRFRSRLPEEVDDPVVRKAEADAQGTIYLAFSSSQHGQLEISEYANRFIKDQIQSLPGVAQINIFGERKYAMRIWLDPTRLAAYNITVQDVEEALRRQNVEIPSGRIESAQREFNVRSRTDLQTSEQFNATILREDAGYLVRLRDVGRAEIGPADERRSARFRGKEAINLAIVKQATANPLEVSQSIRAVLPQIQANLPEGMTVDIAYDRAAFIQESIDRVYTTIGEAVLLVVIIIFVMLRSFRATLIPIMTIPVSLIGAFALMYALGFTINSLTLLALVLAIGLVVDDSIVMMENIFRHVERGEPPVRAAILGSREIGFAVIAMTMTLAAVFIPVGFISGNTGRLFTEFAWALAGAVLVSGFVALTLSPMMCSKLLKPHAGHAGHGDAQHGDTQHASRLQRIYGRILHACLEARLVVVTAGLIVAGLSAILFGILKSELAPVEDRGTIIVSGSGPDGATLAYTDTYARQVEGILANVPEIERYMIVVGAPTVSGFISFSRLIDWEERDRKQQAIVDDLRGKLEQVPGVRAFPINPATFGQRASARPVQFVIKTTASYDELGEMVDRLMAEARKNPGITNLDTDLSLNQPQFEVFIDRDKAGDLGVDVSVVGRTLETMLGGRQVTRFKRGGDQYDVIVSLADVDRRNPDDLARLYVKNRSGEMIPLSTVATIRETVAPVELNHFSQLRAAWIIANLAPDYSLGEALGFLEETARRILPANATYDFDGESREFQQSSRSLYITFALALLFIYLVLAAQFESFVDPLVIMLTVPLSITGALGALYLAGGTLNIYSQIGLVTLIGLITKHGILIVNFANQLRDEGKAMREAVVEAAVIRLRPILMTTAAMVLGSLPLAISTGAGAESRTQIGLVVVGGLLIGTFFTLFVIPVAYSLISRPRRPVIVPAGRTPATKAPSSALPPEPAE